MYEFSGGIGCSLRVQIWSVSRLIVSLYDAKKIALLFYPTLVFLFSIFFLYKWFLIHNGNGIYPSSSVCISFVHQWTVTRIIQPYHLYFNPNRSITQIQ